ncbi:MAG: hypothetical protein CUN56_13385 [Phototrophicales bacterium]|nr:MAG: hypothetical protein CUN56_13385 [Phototrophicales bacterium]RMG74342.1 MAG: hypothetical protein D6711_09050 [Chloroflexota bacterium]
MGKTLYVANLTQNVTEDDIKALFDQFGEVESVQFGLNERFNIRYALVSMAMEKAATKANHTLNGYVLDGQYISISYPEVDMQAVERGLSKKARETAEAVVKELGEEWRKPVRRIHSMVLLCGHSFVLHLLKEAHEIYEGEGMMTQDGSRKRSLGGVFFTLANHRMSPELYYLIHIRGGKLPGYKKEDDRAIYHLIRNPHKFDLKQ